MLQHHAHYVQMLGSHCIKIMKKQQIKAEFWSPFQGVYTALNDSHGIVKGKWWRKEEKSQSHSCSTLLIVIWLLSAHRPCVKVYLWRAEMDSFCWDNYIYRGNINSLCNNSLSAEQQSSGQLLRMFCRVEGSHHSCKKLEFSVGTGV